MSRHTLPPRPMETIVRLRRGTIPRTVRIALTATLEGADPEVASRIFEVFTRGIDAGSIPPEKVLLSSATVTSHEEHGLFVETWEAAFPRMAPGGFEVLARMAASRVRGAQRLEIREDADERVLLVRSFERASDATILEVPWRIEIVAAAQAAVRIVFAEPITAATVERASVVLQAWADVLTLGGFPGSGAKATSTGLVSGVDATAERELVLRFTRLACGHDAWEALFEALLRVDEQATIELVEIRGG